MTFYTLWILLRGIDRANIRTSKFLFLISLFTVKRYHQIILVFSFFFFPEPYPIPPIPSFLSPVILFIYLFIYFFYKGICSQCTFLPLFPVNRILVRYHLWYCPAFMPDTFFQSGNPEYVSLRQNFQLLPGYHSDQILIERPLAIWFTVPTFICTLLDLWIWDISEIFIWLQ